MRRSFNYFTFRSCCFPCAYNYGVKKRSFSLHRAATLLGGNQRRFFVEKLNYSTVVSSKEITEKSIKELLEEYPEPKGIIQRIINKAYLISESQHVKPNITFQQVTFESETHKAWHATLTMNWPEKFSVEGVANKKSEAERIAYLLACQKMKENGNLDENNNPVVLEKTKVFGDNLRTAKADLSNVFQIIWAKHGDRSLIPHFETTRDKGAFDALNVWRTKLTLKYPELQTFEGLSSRLGEAEKIASAKALNWLREKRVIDHKNRPILHSQDDEKLMLDNQKSPCPLYLPDELKTEMKTVLTNYNSFKQANKSLFESLVQLNDLAPMTENLAENEEPLRDLEVRSVFTEEPIYTLTEEQAKQRNLELFAKQSILSQASDPEMVELQAERSNLPIAKRREEILQLINDNQVVVLSGETGCGKTTQVPQYIFESFVNELKGSECNIVVTQPRRISAITVAERVAEERGERVGGIIGHQVRLNKCLPEGNGAILYCSTGILLRKLCFNPNLEGVSHVIVDEVHERSIQIDFLLILLKNLLESNKNLKLILMSASFNTHSFSQYFNQCPIIHVPGYLFPVREYFLEDFADKVNFCGNVSSKSKVDIDLISKMITYVDSTQPPGAILCFLPGWNEIKSVSSQVHQTLSDKSKYVICLLHSRLLPEEQKQAFLRPPDGVRKIVLATNVAESSVTINDVVYVVDSGFHKATSFDRYTGSASLGMRWITKANVRQRRGRAGRVQPGVCYYGFTRKIFMEMDDYPIPEMLRIPLEKVVLDCKLYFPDAKAEDFLSLALQPPSRTSIQLGIQELTMMGILDQSENLTMLGNTVVRFGSHPRLSKALVMAAFLRCIDPILTISALLTVSQEPFTETLDKKDVIKKVKQSYSLSRFGDHLALFDVFCKWNETTNNESDAKNQENYLLDEDNLTFIKQLKYLFAENLFDAGLIDDVDSATNPNSLYNQNSKNFEVVLAALSSGFYPNVIKVMQGELAHGKLNKDIVVYPTVRNQKAFLQSESVVSREYKLPTPWLIYFSAMRSEARRLMLVPGVSLVPGVCLLLFAGQELVLKTISKPNKDSNDEVLLLVDDSNKLCFSSSTEEAQLLSDTRQSLCELFQIYLSINKQTDAENKLIFHEFFDSEVLPILREVLRIPQVPFTPGKKYTFVEGEMVSKDLE